MRHRGTIRRQGFSLVEILIAVLILGVGLTMIAGAFPVGLAFYEQSADETTAALLARSMLGRLQASRTFAYCGMEIGRNYPAGSMNTDGPRAERWGQVAIDECFEPNAGHVQYLFDTSGGKHTAAAGHPGELLESQGLDDDTNHGNHSSDIDDWLPRKERVSGVDPRFCCHVFYRSISAPLGDTPSEPATYVVYLVVQKAPPGVAGTASWDERFPGPSGERTVTAVSGQSSQVSWPDAGFVVRPGAMLVDVEDGDWYRVTAVEGSTLTLNRSASGLGGHAVRVLNDCVSMYRGIVSKEAIR